MQRASNSKKPTSAAILDWTQTILDGLSIVSDLVVPGAGGVWDLINAAIYFIRAWTTSNTKAAKGLYMCGMIQLACVMLLGPGQTFGMVLKLFAKGKPVAKTGLLKRGLIWMTSVWTQIANGARRLALKVLNNKYVERAFTLLGGGIFGSKYGKTKLELLKNSFEAAIASSKKNLDELLAALPASRWKSFLSPKKIGTKALGEMVSEEAITNSFKRLRFPVATLKASGFVQGKTYNYASKEFSKATINKISGSNVTCNLIRADGTSILKEVPISEFLDTAAGQFLRNKKFLYLPKGRLIATVLGRHYVRGWYYNDGVWKFDEEKVNSSSVDPNEIALTNEQITQKQSEVSDLFVIIDKAYGKELNGDDYSAPELIAFFNELERKYQIPTSNDVNDGNIAILIRDLLKKGYPKFANSATYSLSSERRINLILNILRKNPAEAIKEMDKLLQKVRTKRGG